jgi:uncharacterized SAM-binding protein YcdF (DUF218 family)
MLLQLKTRLRELVLPPTSLLLLGFLGLWLWHRRPRVARALLSIALASLWLLSIPQVANRLVLATQRYPALELRTAPQAQAGAQTGAQAIVIIGGGGQRAFAPEYGGPAAGAVLLERLAYGAYLARRTGLPVLVSGHQIEAVAMRATLERNFDIMPRWYEDQAYDTFENARNSARLLRADGIDRVLLVSDTVHLWRAAQEFRAAGIQVVPAPVTVAVPGGPEPGWWLSWLPEPEALRRSYGAIYELLGEQARVAFALTHLRRQ